MGRPEGPDVPRAERRTGLAEREGFEPSRRFPAYTLSRRAPSTTRPPLRSRPDKPCRATLRKAAEVAMTRGTVSEFWHASLIPDRPQAGCGRAIVGAVGMG